MELSDMTDYFPIRKGTLLASCYKVQAFLGEGCFGKVARCVNIATNTKVAIKITKDKPCFTAQALEEIKILKQLQHLDPDKCSLVRWNGSFIHGRFICLEFELLDLNLYEYTRQRRHKSLSIDEIRPVIHQLTTALLHLEALEIIHADLKPENIMVVNRRQQPLQVKLIDFGLARYVSDARQGSCVQSLWYRAPEVMLGQKFTESIDMWSLGVVAAELALGYRLFPGYHEYDQMKFIVDTLGQPPDYLMNCGQKSAHFFHIQSSFNQQTWKLKSPEEFARLTGYHFRENRHFRHSSLDALENVMPFRNKAKKKELQNFVDLLKQMLLVDKNGRIIPLKVLEHPFFSVEQHTDSSQNMNIKSLTLDMMEVEPNVTQQPSSQKKSVHSFELCNVAFKATTPHEETVFTHPENVCAKLEDEEDAAMDIGSEVVVETSRKRRCSVKRFFKRVRKGFSSRFHSDHNML